MLTHVTYIDRDDIISELGVYCIYIYIVCVFHVYYTFVYTFTECIIFMALLHFVCTSFKMCIINTYIQKKTEVKIIEKIWYFIGEREANKWRKFQSFKKVWVSN